MSEFNGKYMLTGATHRYTHGQSEEGQGYVITSIAHFAADSLHFTALPAPPAAEIYDWPGEYAQHFDGIDNGADAPPADDLPLAPPPAEDADALLL